MPDDKNDKRRKKEFQHNRRYYQLPTQVWGGKLSEKELTRIIVEAVREVVGQREEGFEELTDDIGNFLSNKYECPECGSTNLAEDVSYYEGVYNIRCEECGWTGLAHYKS